MTAQPEEKVVSSAIDESAPLAIDLCCGTGGWTDAFLAAGFRVVGFDVVRSRHYRGQLVLQDIRTIDGRRLSGARIIVASPPCQEFSRFRMPWTRRRNPPEPDLSLVDACYRIAREAGVPLILENVREAQRWLGRASFAWGAFHLWGDGVPAILPRAEHRPKESYASTAADLRARIPAALAGFVAEVYAA